MRFWGLAILSLAAISACTTSNVTALSSDTVLIQTRAAPACGSAGAQKVALETAAIETLKRGYDRFFVVAADTSSNVGVVGYTPVYGTTTTYGNATV